MKDFKRYFGISVHDAERFCEYAYKVGINPLPLLRDKNLRIPLVLCFGDFNARMSQESNFGFTVLKYDDGLVHIIRHGGQPNNETQTQRLLIKKENLRRLREWFKNHPKVDDNF